MTGESLSKIKLQLLSTDEMTANIAAPYVISVWGISKQKSQLLLIIFHDLVFEELVFTLFE